MLVVQINRPEVRNAVDPDVSAGLAAAMDTLDADPSLRVGILVGTGPHFLRRHGP
ncbi:hypothetical protein [Microbacterium sp. A93]|uniref:hypothetical protein n=1 Tax=Microbacterium sp. A93 TaxID=3450716 RepID=UPI003F439560